MKTIEIALGVLVFSLCAASGADGLQSQTTYSKAYGQTKHPVSVEPQKDLPRYPAVEPAEAVRTWKLRPGFDIQLAAGEPQTRDPVAVCFDERGRMFACEMIDYSEMRDASPHLGRISMLEDKDGDGIYETSTVFADDLPWPTGLIWAGGGLYVGATPDIWRFEDRDGDGRADVREKVFTGFGSGLKILNVQGLLNSFQWGPDNRIHVLAGGGNRGAVSCSKRADLPAVELAGRDFWFDPRTYEFGVESGGAQYGMSFDNYGRRFGCSNSDHLQHWLYDAETLKINPSSGLLPARQSIAADGGAAEVYRISPDEPWRIVRTRWRIAGAVPGAVEGGGRVSGYFTGATGTTIYRGDAFGPDFLNNSFTGDAGGQLVHRKKIRPTEDGVNLTGSRSDEERTSEFAASKDTWVRVVNFANAPDGCLYVCDMYREIIEHPWSIPDEIKKHLDLNSGNDRGRIYRIAPQTGASRIGARVKLLEADTAELVRLLGHPNGWHRDTAQRLLVERQDRVSVPILKRAMREGGELQKIHALSALHGQGACTEDVWLEALGDPSEELRLRALALLNVQQWEAAAGVPLAEALQGLAVAPSPRVRFHLALLLGRILSRQDNASLAAACGMLASRDHGHPLIGPAVLNLPTAILARNVLPVFTQDPGSANQAVPFVAGLLEILASEADPAQRTRLVHFVARSGARIEWLRALGVGLKRAGVTIQSVDTDARLAPVFERALFNAQNRELDAAQRLAALELVDLSDWKDFAQALSGALDAGAPEVLQNGALKLAGMRGGREATSLILSHWKDYGEKVKGTALDALLGRPERLPEVLTALESGIIAPADLTPLDVQRLTQHKDKSVAEKSRSILKSVLPPDRNEVVAKYAKAVELGGDAVRGHVQYQQRCAVCHRAAGEGFEVGPDLATVKAKGRSGVLTAVIDPNKEVAAQYIQYVVNTKSGDSFSGMIAEDSASSVSLKGPGGVLQKILRADIKSSSATGQSLMPEGVEGGMSVQDLADLLSFIEGLR